VSRAANELTGKAAIIVAPRNKIRNYCSEGQSKRFEKNDRTQARTSAQIDSADDAAGCRGRARLSGDGVGGGQSHGGCQSRAHARIEAAIKAIGYKRNAIARQPENGTTRTIGLTVADITNPFFTDVVSVIQEVLHRAGYAVMLCSNDEDIDTQDEQIQLLLDRMVDGLIISPAGDDANLKRILEGTTIPVVLIDRVCDGVETDAVVLDNQRAVQDAISYMLRLGHRRNGYISGSLTPRQVATSGRLTMARWMRRD